MQLNKWTACVAGAAIVISSAALSAQDPAPTDPVPTDPAPTATFSRIKDAVPNRFFDAETTRPDELDGNRLIIGFNTGLDPATFRYRDFRASTAAFYSTTAMDTIRFKVTAPEGYYIATITYTQRGTGSVVRTGRAAGGANWVVGGFASDLGQFGTNPSLSWTMDLTNKRLKSVPVAITNSLFVFSTPVLGSANLLVSSADVVVTLQPIPVVVPEVPE